MVAITRPRSPSLPILDYGRKAFYSVCSLLYEIDDWRMYAYLRKTGSGLKNDVDQKLLQISKVFQNIIYDKICVSTILFRTLTLKNRPSGGISEFDTHHKLVLGSTMAQGVGS